jgi:hypothetical protein
MELGKAVERVRVVSRPRLNARVKPLARQTPRNPLRVPYPATHRVYLYVTRRFSFEPSASQIEKSLKA